MSVLSEIVSLTDSSEERVWHVSWHPKGTHLAAAGEEGRALTAPLLQGQRLEQQTRSANCAPSFLKVVCRWGGDCSVTRQAQS